MNAVIADNACTNVDAQCLIATAEESGKQGEVGRSHGIEFTGNKCEVQGSQAVLVQWFPDVVVRGNAFDGPALTRAAYYGDGSTGGEFSGNTVRAGVPPVEVEANSRQGFTADVPN